LHAYSFGYDVILTERPPGGSARQANGGDLQETTCAYKKH